MTFCAIILFCKSESGGIPWSVSKVVFSKLALGILLISDKLLANSNIKAAPCSLFSRLLASIFRLRRLLLSTVPLVPLLRLDSVLLKKLSPIEIEKEFEGSSSDSRVNEKRSMIVPINPKVNLEVKYRILTGSCLLVISYQS